MSTEQSELQVIKLTGFDGFPPNITFDSLAQFFHEEMKPWQDTVESIKLGIAHAFVNGGFVLIAMLSGKLVGGAVVLNSGMKGYVPENFFLFLWFVSLILYCWLTNSSVDDSVRNQGIGRKLMEGVIKHSDGPIELHVEYDNPARRLYERMGFVSKYADMRYEPPIAEKRARE